MNRVVSLTLLAGLFAALAPGVADADPITYTVSATGDGGTLSGYFVFNSSTLSIGAFDLSWTGGSGATAPFELTSAGGDSSSFVNVSMFSSYDLNFFRGGNGNVHASTYGVQLLVATPFSTTAPGTLRNSNDTTPSSVGENSFAKGDFISGTVTPTNAVPEPASLLMTGGALGVFALFARRRLTVRAGR